MKHQLKDLQAAYEAAYEAGIEKGWDMCNEGVDLSPRNLQSYIDKHGLKNFFEWYKKYFSIKITFTEDHAPPFDEYTNIG